MTITILVDKRRSVNAECVIRNYFVVGNLSFCFKLIRSFRPSGTSPKSGGFGKLKTIKASLSREVAATRLTEGFL